MAFEGYSERGQGSEERGPGTFTYAPHGVPQARADGPTLVNMNNSKVRDINTVTQVPGNVNNDQTIGIIAKFASEQLGKKVEEIRGAKFLEGMQRAATGEALTTIINDRPWYSTIFGDGPVAEGARAFEVESRVNKWVAEQDNDMASLRRQSPDAIPGYIASSIKKFQTGDPDTDTMIAMQVMKQAPALIKRHTRENFAHVQEEAAIKQFGMWTSGAAGLQAIGVAAKDGYYTPNEMATREDSFLMSLQPPVGSNPDTWNTRLNGFIGHLAEQGQFHALGVIEKNGIIGAMKPDDRIKTEKLMDIAKRQHASHAADGYASQIADIQAKARLREMNANDVVAAYDAIDADYQARTGNSAGIVPRATRSSTEVSAIQAQARYEAAAVKDIVGAEKGAAQDAEIGKSLVTTTSGELVAGGLSPSLVDPVMYERFASFNTSDPVQFKQQISLLVHDARGERANPLIKAELANLVNSATSDTIDDNYLKGYMYWKEMGKTLQGGLNARGVYFDSKASSQYAAFDRHLAGRDPKEFGQFAFQSSQTQRLRPGHEWTAAEKKGVEKFIENNYNEMKGTWFLNDNNLTKASKDVIFDMFAVDYKELSRNNADVPAVLTEVNARARAQGLESYGDYAWKRDPERPPLNSYFKETDIGKKRLVTDKELNEGINALVQWKAKKMAGEGYVTSNIADIQVLRGDINGKPAFQMLVTDTDGMAHLGEFDADDIEAVLKGQAFEKLAAAAPRELTPTQKKAKAEQASKPTPQGIFSTGDTGNPGLANVSESELEANKRRFANINK